MRHKRFKPLLARSRPNRLLAAIVILVVIISGIILWYQLRAASVVAWPLRVSANSHTLEDQNGQPFLYTADTAWTMLSNLSVANAEKLIDTRKAQGFDAIQSNLLYWDGFGSGPHGAPFTNNDVTRPNETYWSAVDQIMNYAKSQNMLLLVGTFPTDGNEGQVSPSAGSTYGTWLGNRYKNQGNLLWYVGHDDDPSADLATNEAIGAALKAAAPTALVSMHSWGGAKPWEQVGSQSWYGFYSFQWNGNDSPYTYQSAAEGYGLSPHKPFLNIEPAYEPTAASGSQTSTNALDVRQNGWWSVLGGAMGVTYGGPSGAWNISDSVNWSSDINRPAATQTGNINKILSTVAWSKLVPDSSHQVVTSGFGSNGSRNYVTTGAAADGSLIVAYLPASSTITVNLAKLSKAATATWYDPTTGAASGTPSSVGNTGSQQFAAPGRNSAGDSDWVLVLNTGAAGTSTPTPTPTPTVTPTPTKTPTPTPTATPIGGTTSVNDTSFTYTGSWSTSTDPAKFDGDDHYSSTTGDTYALTFSGVQAKLYMAKAPHHGIAGVKIDNGTETLVDLYAATRADQQLVYTSPVLASGTHTVTVRVTGTHNAASTDYVVNADRIDVVAGTATPTPTPTPGDLNGDGHVNVFDLSTLLSHWGQSGTGDVNGDGTVNIFDLSQLLSRWTG